MTQSKIKINLLPISLFERSYTGKAIAWFLNVGKYIIIIIELMVLGAFIFRFALDKKLADLNETIQEKQAMLASFGNIESDFRTLQQKTETIKKIQAEQLPTQEYLETISSLIPTDIYLTHFSLTPTNLNLDAVSLSNASLATFLTGLQKSNKFAEINLSNLTTGGSGKPEISFSLKASLKSK